MKKSGGWDEEGKRRRREGKTFQRGRLRKKTQRHLALIEV